MRLVKLKLAGFKSFVDPTTVAFPSSLTGVVGPNGCGKSNIIDAVRWVMGEISAKHLRGDSMADVVFNGSAARKPVGTASVELIFDNGEGKIGGQYANYSEIALRRTVSRDGTSDYFINGTKVRRKDITQLFLGTGLGSRSYAIIEQGMISRIIEAKPDELRAFLEEAAGISRYKERRRETESRIAHTRENLERLSDVRDEVEKQIRHLQRQAATARRYQALKEEERKLQAELLALRMRVLDGESAVKDAAAGDADLALQAAIADLRECEAQFERLRAAQSSQADALAAVQGRYYEAGADVTRTEQSLQHSRELRQRLRLEHEQLEAQRRDVSSLLSRDRDAIATLTVEIAELTPGLDEAHTAEQSAAARLLDSEGRLADWQTAADAHAQQTGAAQRETQVERTRIEELENQQRRSLSQRERLHAELAGLAGVEDAAAHEELSRRENSARGEGDRAQAHLAGFLTQLNRARDQERAATEAQRDAHKEWQSAVGRQVSLDALQRAALGKAAGKVTQWLERHSLGGNPRLVQQMHVDKGWERAVETVLGAYLEAVCVERIDDVANLVGGFEGGEICFLDHNATAAPAQLPSFLQSKVHGPESLVSVLGSVHVAADLPDALSRRRELQPGESLITQDGIWVGRDWLRVQRDHDPRAGVLERETALRELRVGVTALANEVKRRDATVTAIREQILQLEAERERAQSDVNRRHREQADLQGQLLAGRTRREDRERRRTNIDAELAESARELAATDDALRAARGRMQVAIDHLAALEPERMQLEQSRESLRTALAEARTGVQAAQAHARTLAIHLESRRSSRESLNAGLDRTIQQLALLDVRREEVGRTLSDGEAPLATLELSLSAALERRTKAEAQLRAARIATDELEASVNQHDELRIAAQLRVDGARQSLDEARLAAQETRVRREAVAEQLAATHFAFEMLTTSLAADANVEAWETQLHEATDKIERLGQVNLAAIEEFKEQSERKEYLDRQYKDLTDALETLEAAIKKIDRETRTRFQDTFDRVNAGLKEKFPRLFGGGHAYLELEGEDTLAAGVSIMARPPGKRNSTISQLSGGEKALTAVALVFSIFELNPAPFCLLDEVDAPLDDHNVGRFCDIVKDMSRAVQFIFITHNKATMELASQLVGVTMNEPGVSRLVAVDVDEAVRMAAM